MTATKTKDRPWIFRTYSGHSSAKESNQLYKKNLAKGQTGLSIAFDLPTQIGYDSDHPLAQGEVGKVGVPICHIEDMDLLFKDIPVQDMNTSMTINATAAYMLSLYIATCERQGGDPQKLKGTTQNDILKEYLSRGTYSFPPEPSLKLTTDIIGYTYKELPKWNPINICPYHLQEAGATPVQELAYGLCHAITVLDLIKDSGGIPKDDFQKVVGRISFFLDSGIRFIEEMCKTRAFTRMWKEICENRYGVTEEKYKRFRYGVQVNSLGLTEAQPENNLIRIVLESLGVTLSKRSRARALQLPAWNEALGLPTAWDQQLSLRMQQILAYETDLLDFKDIFDGSPVIEDKVQELIGSAQKEISKIQEMGGAVSAIESGYVKSQLVMSNALRLKRIEEGSQKLVGVNCYQETENSPLDIEGAILKPDEKAVKEQIYRLQDFRAARSAEKVQAALKQFRSDLVEGKNIMPSSIACAHAGVTMGEWSQMVREIHGEYRAPTGVAGITVDSKADETEALRQKVKDVEKQVGHKIRLVVGKPGLDGHSNGAEQIAIKARDVGLEVIYQGIRLTPKEIVSTAIEEDADLIGLSVLSGSHVFLITEVMSLLKKAQHEVPVVVGGIIPDEDVSLLKEKGVRAVYTPKDYELNKIMSEMVGFLTPPTPS